MAKIVEFIPNFSEGRRQEVIDAIIANKAVYLVAIGGTGVAISQCVKSAEVIAYDDYVKNGGVSGSRAAGALRPEGKEYEMKDGDVVEFLFSK